MTAKPTDAATPFPKFAPEQTEAEGHANDDAGAVLRAADGKHVRTKPANG